MRYANSTGQLSKFYKDDVVQAVALKVNIDPFHFIGTGRFNHNTSFNEVDYF